MKKKIILSLIMILAVSAIAIIGTTAYFSDTEISTGNTFSAGEFNLLIDSTCSYNGESQASCTWLEKDLAGELFFNFNDVKPGDFGEDTISLHIINNPAWLCAEVKNITNNDNNCNKPEQNDGDTTCGNPGPGEGELQNNLKFTVWKDDCDNILENDETIILNNQPAQNGIWAIADSSNGNPISGDTTICYGLKWNVPLSVNNIIQTDSISGDIKISAVQSRHMDNFKCSDLDTGGEQIEPICGNNIIESGETCDDGNITSEDGCSSTCQTESPVACIPATEVCDGQDNDCDKLVDNDLTPPEGILPVGVCIEALQVCQGVNGWSLQYPNSYELAETLCDGLDNDCDGNVDENCSVCLPITEICGNGIDEDCNGSDLTCVPECTNNNQCDDNKMCTADTCVDGKCVRMPNHSICASQALNSCLLSTCVGTTGDMWGCTYQATANVGTSCSDLGCKLGGSCDGYTCNSIGACIAPAQTPPTGCANCDDGNSCTNDYCENLVCKHTNLIAGQCIFGGTCINGAVICNPNPNCTNNCDDGNPCTIDSCEITGCIHTAKNCDDGNTETHDECNPNSGECINFQYPVFDISFCFNLPWGGRWCNGQ